MKILHVVPLIQASTGGPALSVTRLASEQVRLGHQATVASLFYPHLGPQVEAAGVRLLGITGGFCAVRGRGWSPAFRRMVMEEARNADLVHNHGLWMWPNAYARESAIAAGKPLVISPRGMLDAWSLKRSRLRKAVAWRLFEKMNLQAAEIFHATSKGEAESVRAVGLTQPIVIAPNGVDLPDLARKPERALLEQKFPVLRGKRWVVFMSRIHPKKGIDVLLRAWANQAHEVKSSEGSSVLVLAGPDLIGYRKNVERMVQEMRLQSSVVFTGEVRGREKAALLANATVFVLPSYSENFGIAIAEALAWGRPVITSTATPWDEIAAVSAGWWVRPEADAVSGALEEALSESEEALLARGESGRRLVTTKYSWRSAAETVTKAYSDLLAVER